MATKKKAKKKLTKSKKTAGAKAKPAEKQTKKAPGKAAKKKSAPVKAAVKKKSVAAAKKKSVKSAPSRKTASLSELETRGSRAPRAFSRESQGPRSGQESGDLQGLSDVEGADSESVDELLEEGNAFEAGVVAGVEEADDDGPREVHTHEVPEDDVPEEYLDED
jgi:hypothetical protein